MAKNAEQLRNVAVVAHGGSGKTTLAEAILLDGKATNRLGKVDDGTSNLDFEPEEIKRRITISTSFHLCDWKKSTINLIDTPGMTIFCPIPNSRFRQPTASWLSLMLRQA